MLAILALFTSLLAASLTELLASSSPLGSGLPNNWPVFGGNFAHTGYNSAEQRLTVQNVSQLKLKWTSSVPRGTWSSPAIVDDRLYVGSFDGKVYAIDTRTGVHKWVFAPGDAAQFRIFGSASVYNHVVYIGNVGKASGACTTTPHPSFLYALEAMTGKLLWKFRAEGQIFSAAAVAHGFVYLGAANECLSGFVYALQAKNGHIAWRVARLGGVWYSPTLDEAGTTLFSGVGNPENKMYAFDALSGQIKWSFSAPPRDASADEDIGDSATLSQDILYFGSKNGKVYALNARTGKQRWIFDTHAPDEEGVRSTAAVANSVVYVGASTKRLYALDAKTGKVKWTFLARDQIVASPVVANGVVYAAGLIRDKYIYALDAATGAKLWQFRTGDAIYGNPVVLKGVLYVAATDGHVYAFAL